MRKDRGSNKVVILEFISLSHLLFIYVIKLYVRCSAATV